MKEIIFSKHSIDRIKERGSSREEVIKTINEGEIIPTKEGRIAFKKNYPYNKKWRGREYKIKQVVVITKEEGRKIVVITVYTFYIGEIK